MRAINPTPQKLQALISSMPKGVPVFMLNLLKYREIAEYADSLENISGKAAYQIYSKTALKCVKSAGGEVVWMGETIGALIAPDEESWDEVFIVRYPSIEKFVEMISSQHYKSAVKHRTAALYDSRLIANIVKA